MGFRLQASGYTVGAASPTRIRQVERAYADRLAQQRSPEPGARSRMQGGHHG